MPLKSWPNGGTPPEATGVMVSGGKPSVKLARPAVTPICEATGMVLRLTPVAFQNVLSLVGALSGIGDSCDRHKGSLAESDRIGRLGKPEGVEGDLVDRCEYAGRARQCAGGLQHRELPRLQREAEYVAHRH